MRLKVTATAEVKVVSVGWTGTGGQRGAVPSTAVHHPETRIITERSGSTSTVHRLPGSGKVRWVLSGNHGSVVSGVSVGRDANSGMISPIEEHSGVHRIVHHIESAAMIERSTPAFVVDHPAGVRNERFRGHDLVTGATGKFVNNTRMLLLLLLYSLLLKSARGLVERGVRRRVLLRGY